MENLENKISDKRLQLMQTKDDLSKIKEELLAEASKAYV